MNEAECKTWRDNHGNACAKHIDQSETLVFAGIAAVGSGVIQLVRSGGVAIFGSTLQRGDAVAALETLWLVLSVLALARMASGIVSAGKLERARVPPPLRLSYVAGSLMSRDWYWSSFTIAAVVGCWWCLCVQLGRMYISYGMLGAVLAVLMGRVVYLRLSGALPIASTRTKLGWPGPSSNVPDLGERVEPFATVEVEVTCSGTPDSLPSLDRASELRVLAEGSSKGSASGQ
jgi:hypothetical protein